MCIRDRGGTGGSGNAVGGNSATGTGLEGVCGGGGGWGAAGGNGNYYSTVNTTVGLGGNAVALNGHTITWTSGDTSRVYGAVA